MLNFEDLFIFQSSSAAAAEAKLRTKILSLFANFQCQSTERKSVCVLVCRWNIGGFAESVVQQQQHNQ